MFCFNIMFCFNFMLDLQSIYQPVEALQAVWSTSGSALPLHEGTGSGLAIWIAKSMLFYAEVKTVLLSCASLPSCLVHVHTPCLPRQLLLPKKEGR